MVSNIAKALFLACCIVLLIGLFVWAVRTILRSWKFTDNDDLAGGFALAGVMLLLAGGFLAVGIIPAGVILFALIPLGMSLYFESGTLGGGEYGHVTKHGLLRTTWEGPGRYLIARQTKITKVMLVAHAINVPKPAEKKDDEEGFTLFRKKKVDAKDTTKKEGAKPEFWALSSDRVLLNVHVLCKFQLNPEGERGTPEFHRNLWIMGDSDKIRERVRPLVEMAIRDVIGRYSALDAATWNREPVRESLWERLEPLFPTVGLVLKVVVLGEVMPENDVRRYELHMRELEELEKAMGKTGLAVHQIDALEKAGVVVVPSDPSVLLAAGGRPPLAPPSTPKP